MRVKVQDMIDVMGKWKADGFDTIDLVMLFNIARDLAAGNEDV
jgi:hypothetical protein